MAIDLTKTGYTYSNYLREYFTVDSIFSQVGRQQFRHTGQLAKDTSGWGIIYGDAINSEIIKALAGDVRFKEEWEY